MLPLPQFTVEPISDRHDGADFHCGGDHVVLSEYIRAGYALRDQRLDRLRTYVLVPLPVAEEAGSLRKVAGFFSLEASRMETADVPVETWSSSYGVPPDLPVIYLSMVARHSEYRGQGIGDILMAAILDICVQTSALVGVTGIYLVAVSERAYDLYRTWGFLDLDGDSFAGYNRMFLPMQDARMAVALEADAEAPEEEA